MRIALAVPVAIIALSLGSPAYTDSMRNAAPTRCTVGSACDFEGTLRILRGVPHAAAYVDRADGNCISVALPERVLRHWRSWQDARVRISGDALSSGVADGVASIQYRDRWLAAGGCPASPVVLYVTIITKVVP
jgi:hypothetical protein